MKIIRRSVVALGILLVAPFSFAQMPAAEVQELLGKVGNAYSKMESFSAVIESSQQMGPAQRISKTVLTFQKPSRLAAEVSNGIMIRKIISDGTKAYSDSSLDKTTYTEQPVGSIR